MINNDQQVVAGVSNVAAVTTGLPPSYETATYDNGSKQPVDVKQPLPQPAPMIPSPGSAAAVPHDAPVPVTHAGAVTVYHYIHPMTQQRIDSLLPPSHPEMQCLQHGHVPRTHFGVAGILAAIFWFPLGLGCLLIDKDTRCTRCKMTIVARFGSEP